MMRVYINCLILFFTLKACGQKTDTIQNKVPGLPVKTKDMQASTNLDTIAFGQGCFWCAEAIFQRLKGVDTVFSGYMGGKIKNPTYREVCSGLTGHAEVVQVVYDASIISLTQLLEVFFKTHDPTTLNRQGYDVGTQYRSAIFYYTNKQQVEAEKVKLAIDSAKIYANPIVTEISPAVTFYKAEDYHQNYYNLNGQEGYCRAVITPKIEKFNKVFAELKK